MTTNAKVGLAIVVAMIALVLLYLSQGLSGGMGQQQGLEQARERFDGSTDAIQRGRKDLLP